MRPQTMPASVRARRETPAVPDDPAAALQAKRGWVPGFARMFASKPAGPKKPQSDANPLLAFPSETGACTEPVQEIEAAAAAAPDAGKRPAPPAILST